MPLTKANDPAYFEEGAKVILRLPDWTGMRENSLTIYACVRALAVIDALKLLRRVKPFATAEKYESEELRLL